MNKRMVTLCITGICLLGTVSVVPSITSQSWLQLEQKNQNPDMYSLSFETRPGGVTIALFSAGLKIDEKISSNENGGGICEFLDLKPGTYHWKASKYEYEPDEGEIHLQGDMTHIVVLHTVAKLYASVSPRIHNYIKPSTYYEITLIIENKASSPSYLDWEITDYPNFGSDWNAEKEQGEDLPNGDSEEITLSFTSPPDKLFYAFEGNFRIQNQNDPDDVATPSFSLPKTLVNLFRYTFMKICNIFHVVKMYVT